MGLSVAAVQVLSGVEVALWDIRCKATGQSIYRLLGSSRDWVAVYGTGAIAFDQSPDRHVGFFEALLERGVKTIKLRTGNRLCWDVKLIRGVRGRY